MINAGAFLSVASIRLAFCVLACYPVLAGFAFGQAVPGQPAYANDPTNLADAIAKVRSGEFAGIHVEMIARSGAVDAIPILKDQFARSQDALIKAKIANALVRLGEEDKTYWEMLVSVATPAVESDAPFFMIIDPHGKMLPGPSPEFVAWAQAHNVPVMEAGEQSVYVLPGELMLLGSSGDSRAVPLLQKALSSPNYFIQVAASLGLADLKDKASIPLITEACKRAPAEAAAEIAKSLIYFDDPQAQNAVDQYMPKDTAKIYREARAKGKTPFR